MAEGARGWVSARRESTPDQVRFVAAFPLALPSARLAAAAPGQVLLLVGDWLKRDRFIFLGWSGLLLLAPAYLAVGAWFLGTTFVTSPYTHGLASSYLEGASFLTAALSSPAGCLGHSLLPVWGREARGSLSAWLLLGGLWTFTALHGLLSLAGFALRQFEVSRLVLLRPYNAVAFPAPTAAYASAFLVYPAGQASWFFAPSFGAAAIFRFLLFEHLYGLEPLKLQRDLEPWQERRAGELMTHAPLGSLNSVGGVATEVSAVNFASPRSWLTCSHWLLAFFLLAGHWWHGGRSRAAALGAERGLSRRFEPVLFVRAVD